MEQTCPTCGDVLASAACYRCSPNYSHLASPADPASSGSSTFAVIGGVVVVVGVLLLLGNVTGIFPTFPLAGFITICIGGWVSKLD